MSLLAFLACTVYLEVLKIKDELIVAMITFQSIKILSCSIINTLLWCLMSLYTT